MTRAGLTRSLWANAKRGRWLALLSASSAAVLLATWVLAALGTPSARERWGVDQLRVHRTAGGHLLDLRYQVVDPARAGSLLAEESSVYLVHEKSGLRLPVPSTPKAGSLRNTGVPRAGRAYFALFTNPGGLVQRGDQVSVMLGALTAELTVE
jgi:hypothetical protein